MTPLRWLPRLILLAFVILATALARAEDLSEEDVERVVRDYLLENPEVIVEALEILQQREQAAQQQSEGQRLSALSDELTAQPDDPVGGNPNGSLTLVEFFDYNCGYCKRANTTVQALIEANPDLRVVYKEFPILSETSVTAARASLALNRLHPQQYEAFHRQLLERSGSLRNDDEVWAAMRRLNGVDVEAVRRESQAVWVQQALSRNHQLARELNVTGTPTFVVGESVLRGAYPQGDLQAAIDDNHQ